jgi:DNA (cytosine-5)-methyltransferase 1
LLKSENYVGFMNELALFAGVGGGIIGTQQLGLHTVCAVEVDMHRRCVLVQRQNERVFGNPFPVWDDIRTFNGKYWNGRIDIISGGFPCQAFSKAARGRNNAMNLWPEMKRVISEVMPPYVFAENVSTAAIEKAADDCTAMGYKAEMLPLSAADLGADHIRERYWLLAYADDKSKLRCSINAKMGILSEFCEGIWQAHPFDSGVDDGMARRMERYEATGNGQVPAVAAAALWILANAE